MWKEKLAPRASDELLMAQRLILEMTDYGGSLDEILRAIAAFVHRKNPAATCSILLLDPEASAVRIGAPPVGRSTSFNWTIPILSAEGAVLGSLTLHYTHPHVLDDDEIDVANAAVGLARTCFERRSTMAQLRTGHGRFRSLIENTSDIISILDENGIIHYLSPSIERVLGFTPAELLGKCGFDCFHPDDVTR